MQKVEFFDKVRNMFKKKSTTEPSPMEEQLIPPKESKEEKKEANEIDDEVMELKKIFYDFLEKEINGIKQPLNYTPKYLIERCQESYFNLDNIQNRSCLKEDSGDL